MKRSFGPQVSGSNGIFLILVDIGYHNYNKEPGTLWYMGVSENRGS